MVLVGVILVSYLFYTCISGLPRYGILVGELIQILSPIVISLVLIHWFAFFKKPKIQIGLAVIITIYLALNFFLYVYHLDRDFAFDPFFLFDNAKEALPTLISVYDNFVIILILSGLAAVLSCLGLFEIFRFYTFYFAKNKLSLWWLLNTFIVLLVILGISSMFPYEIANVVRLSLRRQSPVAKIYDYYFRESVNLNKQNAVSEAVADTKPKNLFLIQLESLNAELVGEIYTPELISIAKENGIMFPRFQNVSTQTIRDQASILCSILPSLGVSISNSKLLTDNLVCLPRILKQQGYKTLFFKSHDLEFSDTGEFMTKLGFDEIHGNDIMRPGDKKLKWGYREDVYYERVFEYLEKFKDQEPLFAYIATSTTNHYPFYRQMDKNYEDFWSKIPRQNSNEFRDRLTNSTFLQDYFLGEMLRNFFEEPYAANSHLFVFSDTSWPFAIHKNNIHNEVNGWQEDFVSSLAFLPAKNNNSEYEIGKTVDQLYSQIDLLPTILEILNLKDLKFSGQSFFSELTGDQSTEPACLISVQPYGQSFISLIKFPKKWLFNLNSQNVEVFDLSKDPEEKQPESSGVVTETEINLLHECLTQITSVVR